MKFMKKWKGRIPRGIQPTIMLYFSALSVAIMVVVAAVMYYRIFCMFKERQIESTAVLIEQTGEHLEDYLVRMRQVSDAVYYGAIKEYDFSKDQGKIRKGIQLIYEGNKDSVRTIAVYNDYGSLITAEPVADQKDDPDVTHQSWFAGAKKAVENMYFSTPHIQNLFKDTGFRYYSVISLSRVIEITDRAATRPGVLLVDMDFSGIGRMMDKINSLGEGPYFYLCDPEGRLIYHPRQLQIGQGIHRESSRQAAGAKDRMYAERFDGEKRQVIVNTISYTGWKLVGVIPEKSIVSGLVNVRYFILMFMLLVVMVLVFVNRMLSRKLARPILSLNSSVLAYEGGEKPAIFVGGFQEIRHLGMSIQSSYEKIDRLMKRIVREQTERRKSELAALQSQINPHFLYNTLESITWMVEGERNDEAVLMISRLARLFRISLSGGRTVICIRDELIHAKSYMHIQKVRYKNSFVMEFDVDPSVEEYCTPKLVLQPLLENALHYGITGMDDDVVISVQGRKEGDDIVLTVSDTGIGMEPDVAAHLLKEDTQTPRPHSRGQGVGLVNVHRRIRLLFGDGYGLAISSEPDRGTTVTIRLPACAYTEENRARLEKGMLLYTDKEDGPYEV